MHSTRLGSPDGITVLHYEAGEVYDLPGDLFAAFVAEGWASPVVAEVAVTDEKPTEIAVDAPAVLPVVATPGRGKRRR